MPSKANKKAAAAAKSEAARAAAALNAPPQEDVPEQVPAPEFPAAAPAAAPVSTVTAAVESLSLSSDTRTTSSSTSSSSLKCKEEFPKFTPPAKFASLPIGKEKLVTNSFALNVVKPTTVYRYDVTISVHLESDEPGRRPREPMTGSKGGDRKRQEKCSKILAIAFKKLSLKESYIYDGAATIYALNRIKPCNTVIKSTDSDLSTDLKRAHFLNAAGHFLVDIAANHKPTLATSDIFQENLKNMESGDKSLTAVFQMLLGQDAKRNGFISLDGGSQLFDQNSKKLVRPGVEQVEGIGAGVKLAEGKDKKGEVQVVLEPKMTQFFVYGPLNTLLSTVRGNEEGFLRNIRVEKNFGNHAVFKIEGLSRELIGTITLPDGRNLIEVCAETADINARTINPNNRAVCARHGRGEQRQVYNYAVETLLVHPNQRLGPHHGNPPTAQRPHERFAATKRLGEAAKILSPNATLKDFGVAVNPQPLELLAHNVPLPTIVYSGCTFKPDLERKASWQCKRFINPAKWGTVIVAYHSATGGSGDERIATIMKDALRVKAQSLGMEIKNWVVEDLSQFDANNIRALSNKLQTLREQNSRKPFGQRPYFVFIDHPSEPTHAVLKLYERQFQIPTQQLAIGKSASEKPGHVTLANILLKMNVRMGGQNHHVTPASNIQTLWGQQSKTLIISYDVCHASGAGGGEEEPSVVGFAYNASKNPEVITGDFHLQASRHEEVNGDILTARAQNIVKTYTEARGTAPDRVVILRDGVSEGQYAMVMGREVPSIQKGLFEYLKKDLPIAVVIATKRHNNRFFKRSGDSIVTCPPMVAVDHTIVRKDANEMIFVSHCPLKGTSQPILLNVLKNESIFNSNGQLIDFIATLCATHQVSTNMISLPETIYAADEYAKRGSDLYAAYKRSGSNMLTLKELSERLCYSNPGCVFKNTHRV